MSTEHESTSTLSPPRSDPHGYDELETTSRGRAEPPFPNPLAAARHHPVLVAIPVIVLLAIGAALGVVRHPVYTAQAQLSVGRLDVQAQVIPGYVQASEQLAATYSRVLGAAQVIDPVAKTLGRSPGDVQAHVSASPLAVSQIIVVRATGSNQSQAVKLVNATANDLSAYVGTLNATGQLGTPLLHSYRDVAGQLQRAQNQLRRLQARRPNPTIAQQQAINAVEAEISLLQLRENTIGNAYASTQSSVPGGNSATVLAASSVATNDKTHTLELLLLSGLIAGLVIGLALATVRARSQLSAR